ncbi:hypothetical protein ABK040_009741 [Willaertia magna]
MFHRKTRNKASSLSILSSLAPRKIFICFSLFLISFIFLYSSVKASSSSSLSSKQSKPSTSDPVELLYSFPYVMFNFTSESEKETYLNEEIYKYCMLAGIKLDKQGNIYVSLPRWKSSKVPATLAKLVFNNVTDNNDNNNAPLLEPFPSWEWNNVNNVTHGLQSVLGFEIDSKNRMWILDQGKVEGKKAKEGSIKLIIWDLDTNTLIAKYNFTEEQASLTNSFLNDIVVDSEQDIAYISDSGIPIDNLDNDKSIFPQPGLIVFDFGSMKIKRMLDSIPEVMVDQNTWLNVNNKKCLQKEPMKTGVDGIALSCDGNRLYWTPLTSRTLYGIDINLLLMYPPNTSIVHDSIINFGSKISSSDGFIISSNRMLYLTALENNTIYQVDETKLEDIISERKSIKDFILSNEMYPLFNDTTTTVNNVEFVWPDTMSIGPDGYLYFVTNNLCDFVQDLIVDWTKPNFHIHRKYIGAQSYVEGCEKVDIELGAKEWAVIGTLTSLWIIGLIIVLVVVFVMRCRKKNDYTDLQDPLATTTKIIN